jgi:muconolactone delta-isomerase
MSLRGLSVEYLVTMTTQVPPGTPDDAVAEIRGREAARSRELAAQGHLLRLWRPPLGPGEWRTLGLFAADDEARLEEVLASMPLRVWRTDTVTALSPHPNDPPSPRRSPARGSDTEFLTTFTVTAPPGVDALAAPELEAREAERARALAEQGHLVRLWALPAGPEESRALGLWRARDAAAMEDIVGSLPLTPAGWMSTETTVLSVHPNDPAIAAA